MQSSDPWSAERPAQTNRDTDQTLSDTDQTLSDTDQTLSDTDQTLSDTDQAAADSDQAVADLEHDSETTSGALRQDERDAADSDYESSRATRRRTTVVRSANAIERLGAATSRDANSSARDLVAARRDAAAVWMDAEVEGVERRITATPCSGSGQLRRCDTLLGLERQARARAAADRARAAADRAHAAREREAMSVELRRAQLDELTGAYGRAMGRVELSHELDRARRSDGRLVVAFLDVDNMKTINDDVGHAAGDAMLRAVADTLRRSLRPYDPLVRWGGDEFVTAFGGVDLKDAERRFADIRRDLLQRMPTTVSFGLAVWDHSETLDQLIGRADAALISGRRTSDESG